MISNYGTQHNCYLLFVFLILWLVLWLSFKLVHVIISASLFLSERKYFETLMSLLDVRVKEMKSMGNAILKLEVTREGTHSSDKHKEDYFQSASGNGTRRTVWFLNS